MLFYAQLQQMNGKWNDKWKIMVRKWMKDMSISDGKMDNFRAQQSYPHFVELFLMVFRRTGYVFSYISDVSRFLSVVSMLKLLTVSSVFLEDFKKEKFLC